MELIYIVIAIFLAIILADILHGILPKIPIIFFQIMIGIFISYLPIFHHFTFEPEIFMVLIIKPLLFNEAQRISRKELKVFFLS